MTTSSGGTPEIQLYGGLVDRTVRKERKRLFDFIRRRVRSEEDAEDILQDVLYQLAATHSVTEPIEKMTSWLFTVARNKIIDWYRKRKPFSIPTTAFNDDAMPLTLEEILADNSQNPEDLYTRSLVWRTLTEALDDLPEEQRWVFVKHELEGMSFAAMADETGVPLNTLLSRKRYAVLYLRTKLDELYTELSEML
jgi:RNA polymerase sigma factor (sigma-70 family)